MPRLPEDISDIDTGAARPRVGPGDTSDSPSERPASDAQTDSDAQGTGERPEADPLSREEPGRDIEPDELADENEAGVSHSPPDPVRNGGQAGEPGKNDRPRQKLRSVR